ncbi:MAG: FGGY-family carbohydrate kinase, partial [Eubacteriales bacterium]|nr:FGGY-family carbohydrate kinase [Eubacteriales bacterium]
GGGLLAYNYLSGEHQTGMEEGRPLFARMPDARFNLSNFMRTHLYAALATLRLGMDILLIREKVSIDRIYGHGGLFKTPGVGQQIMADSIRTPVSVMETAGEGGAWGIALLAAYMKDKAQGQPLEAYLNERIFADKVGETLPPDEAGAAGFDAYIARYAAGRLIERAAVATMK